MAEFTVKLTAEEAKLLDGKVGPEAQAVVSRAIDALTFASLGEKQAAMVATVLDVARTKGRVTYRATVIRSCPCCGRSDGYWPVKRATRWKRKGQPDYDKPKVFGAYDLDCGFVTVQNHISVGFCSTCGPLVEPVIKERLKAIPCETPAYWPDMPQRFRRWDKMKCGSCGWEGHEGQLRPLRTLFGDGFYQGGCPACSAENAPFAPNIIKRTKGFELTPVTKGEPPTARGGR